MLRAAACFSLGNVPPSEMDLRSLERQEKLRIGLFARTASGRALWGYRADERFLFCSTFKVFLVATVLKLAARKPELMQRRIPLAPGKQLGRSPITGREPLAPWMTVEQLCAAAVQYSDNAAANYLLAMIGGPGAVTRMLRLLGDKVSRLDRTEPALNDTSPSGLLDTTTPRSAADALACVFHGGMMPEAAVAHLRGWMTNEHNGVRRIRAGIPAGWQVANKPGTNDDGSVNDIAALRTRSGQEYFLSIYVQAQSNDILRVEHIIATLAAKFSTEILRASIDR